MEGGMAEENEDKSLGFKWLKKKGVGGKDKKIQFYESFVYDEVEYTLYDCVYMYKEGYPEPYIGKVIKIWELADKTKKVKVQWFFYVWEILNYLGKKKVQDKEIFLASGEGFGMANVNPLEAIAGKCNVVCISKDSRNAQPSNEELEAADYIFYRTFDVQSCTILDTMDEKVGGLEIQYIFNRNKQGNASSIPKLTSERNEDTAKATKCDKTLQLPPQNSSDVFNTPMTDGKDNQTDGNEDPFLVKTNVKGELFFRNVNALLVKRESVVGVKPACEEADNGKITLKGDFNHDETKVCKTPSDQVKAKERARFGQGSNNLKDRPVKKVKSDNSTELNQYEDLKEKLSAYENGVKAPFIQVKVKVKDESGKKAKDDNSFKIPEDKDSKPKLSVHEIDVKAGPTTFRLDKKINDAHEKNSPPTGKGVKSIKDYNDMEGRPSKKAKVDDSFKLSEDNKNHVQKLSTDYNSSNAKDVKPINILSVDNKKSRLVLDSLWTEKESKKEQDDEKVRKFSSGKLPKNTARESAQKHAETSYEEFEITRRPDDDKSKWFRELPWEQRLQNAYEQGLLVLLQNLDPDYTSEEVEKEENVQKMDKKSINKEKRVPYSIASYDGCQLSWRLLDALATCLNSEKLASSILKGSIWHAFNEYCTAKMVQRMAISNPFTGQALVIFKTRDATERVLKKLSTGCLMLSNGRPLVGSRAPRPNLSGKQSTFFGHLVIDKIKIQMQREMKDAVSTSHCSQPNTIEYEMAMDWCALQTRSEIWWSKLYKEQRKQLQNLENILKKK